MSKGIEIKCDTGDSVFIDELLPLQDNMKKIKIEALTKLKRAIIHSGFSAPLLVWYSGGKYYILDGHQRKLALESLRDDGYKIPKIPIIRVEAKDKRDAVLKAIEMGVQYGYLYKRGLKDLINRYELDMNVIDNLINVNLVEVEKNEPEYRISPRLLEENNYIVLKFTNALDWQNAKGLFGIESVKTNDSRTGYMRVGVGRVINGSKVVNWINDLIDKAEKSGVKIDRLQGIYTE